MCSTSLPHQTNPTKALDGTDAVDFGTGSIRSSLCPGFDHIPYAGIRRLALRYDLGAAKYVRDNWKKSLNDPKWVEQLRDHMADHMFKYFNHIEPDDDHLAAIAWGAFALMEADNHGS